MSGVADVLLRAGGIAVLLAVASGVWLVLRHRAGHFRATRSEAVERLTPADLGAPLGARATFVQLSSATCSTCPQVRRVLESVTARDAALRTVELSVESHLDLVRRLDVRRTPTVLLLDGSGALRARMSGALSPAEALGALTSIDGLDAPAPQESHHG